MGVRKVISPSVDRIYSLVSRVYSIFSNIYPDVFIFTGNVSSDKPEPTLMVAGKGHASSSFLSQIYNTKPEMSKRGKIPLWKIPSLYITKTNGIIIEADNFYATFLSKRGFFAIPEWVLFTMDISNPVDEIMNDLKKRHEGNFRKIKRNQYTFEAVRDIDKLRLFYFDMYLPYIKERFGKSSQVTSLGRMEDLLQRGTILLAKRGIEYVSGALITVSVTEKVPIFSYVGVKDGMKEYVTDGAISALYLHAILWAKERGYTLVDCGHSRPLLNDGLLFYKKRWGMRIQKSTRNHRSLYLHIGDPNPCLSEFLTDNLLITYEGDSLKGLLFKQSDESLTSQRIEAIKKKYAMPGLEGFKVVSLEGSGTGTSKSSLNRK
jgi:hypothetical protein